MLGFAALFLGEYRVLAKVDTSPFKTAVAAAKTPAKQGAELQVRLRRGQGDMEGQDQRGQEARWRRHRPRACGRVPEDLSAHLPDPVREYTSTRRSPSRQPKLDRLRRPHRRDQAGLADRRRRRMVQRRDGAQADRQGPDAPLRPRHTPPAARGGSSRSSATTTIPTQSTTSSSSSPRRARNESSSDPTRISFTRSFPS